MYTYYIYLQNNMSKITVTTMQENIANYFRKLIIKNNNILKNCENVLTPKCNSVFICIHLNAINYYGIG